MARPQAVKDINDPRLVKALTHPLRVEILRALQDEDHSPSELADMLQAPLGNVSYHVRQLAELGLLKLVKRTPRRGAIEHHYRAVPAPVSEGAWTGLPESVKSGVLASTLKEIGGEASASASGGGFNRPDSTLARHTLRLDPDGWKALAAATKAYEKAVRGLKHAKNGDGTPASIVTMVFEPCEAKPQPQARKGRPPKAKAKPKDA